MHTVTPDTFDIAVDGRREKDQIWLMIRPLTTATIQFSRIGGPAAECKVSGQSSTPGMNPFAGLAMALGTKFHVPYRELAANSGHETIPGGFSNSGHETIPGGFNVDWQLHVWCRDCCKNVRDGDRGFIYVSANAATLHTDPSTNSPSVGGVPRGARVVFTNTQEKNGMRWYTLVRQVEAPVGFRPARFRATGLRHYRRERGSTSKTYRITPTLLEQWAPAPMARKLMRVSFNRHDNSPRPVDCVHRAMASASFFAQSASSVVRS